VHVEEEDDQWDYLKIYDRAVSKTKQSTIPSIVQQQMLHHPRRNGNYNWSGNFWALMHRDPKHYEHYVFWYIVSLCFVASLTFSNIVTSEAGELA
jgi:hypothetical protein